MSTTDTIEGIERFMVYDHGSERCVVLGRDGNAFTVEEIGGKELYDSGIEDGVSHDSHDHTGLVVHVHSAIERGKFKVGERLPIALHPEAGQELAYVLLSQGRISDEQFFNLASHYNRAQRYRNVALNIPAGANPVDYHTDTIPAAF